MVGKCHINNLIFVSRAKIAFCRFQFKTQQPHSVNIKRYFPWKQSFSRKIWILKLFTDRTYWVRVPKIACGIRWAYWRYFVWKIWKGKEKTLLRTFVYLSICISFFSPAQIIVPWDGIRKVQCRWGLHNLESFFRLESSTLVFAFLQNAIHEKTWGFLH